MGGIIDLLKNPGGFRPSKVDKLSLYFFVQSKNRGRLENNCFY